MWVAGGGRVVAVAAAEDVPSEVICRIVRAAGLKLPRMEIALKPAYPVVIAHTLKLSCHYGSLAST